jgi:hypothetical protein
MSLTWKSAGHFFASAAEKLGVLVHLVQTNEPKIDGLVAEGAAVASVFLPQYAVILSQVPRIEKAVMGEVYSILDKALGVTGQPLNISLDQELADELRTAWPTIKAAMSAAGASTVVPVAVAAK